MKLKTFRFAPLAAVGMSLGFDSRAWRILRDLKKFFENSSK